MTASPQGCGVPEHDELCLCDVVIREPTPVTARIPFDFEHGPAIAHYGRWNGTLVHWFEIYDKAHKALTQLRTGTPPTGMNRRLPDAVYEFLVQGIRDGKQPTPLKNEILARFNVTIDKSYVTHLRKRLAKRGEL